MKLLIIAGPYEADRIRRAAVSAGFETVAIEPGESLSGWIAATRPDLIVMAPQIVNPDPTVALAKVRSTPRGRVPIFFVGDAADEGRFKNLADGFFVRPIAPADLVAQARALVVPSEEKSGPIPRPVAAADIPDTLPGGRPASGSGLRGLPALGLRPLVAQQDREALAAPATVLTPSPAVVRAAGAGTRAPVAAGSGDLLRHLAESIDASLDAEMLDVARGLTGVSGAPNSAADELRDEGSQKTREVDSDVVVRMMMQEGSGGAPVPAARVAPPEEAAGTAAPYESGPIGSPDLAMLFGRIYFDRLNGRLTFRKGLTKKTIYFEKGLPVLASSNLPDDRMGEMLARQGRLTREQRARGAQILETTGRRIGGVLVELGALKDGELPPLVRRHYEEIIYSVFAWPEGGEPPAEEGEWTLGPERAGKDENILLDEPAPALIMEGIRRKYTAPRLLRRLGGGTQVVELLAVDAAASTVLDDMALSDEERTLARRFDGVRTLDEIRAAANVADEIPFALAWALVVLRLAAATRAIEAEASPARGAKGEATGNGAVAGLAGAGAGHPPDGGARDRLRNQDRNQEQDQKIDRARVLSRYALVQEGDYFEVLGLSREATAHEVRRAHQALSRDLSASSLDAQLAVELDGELRAIRSVLDEGARVLGDARLRRRYQAHLPLAPARRSE